MLFTTGFTTGFSTGFTHHHTRGENDMIIFVKDVDVVFVEIKTSAASNNITKGIHQTQNIENFVMRLMQAITGTPTSNLPIGRLVTAPDTSNTKYRKVR